GPIINTQRRQRITLWLFSATLRDQSQQAHHDETTAHWPIGPELPADLGAGGADYRRYHAVPADGVGARGHHVRLDVKIVRDRLSPIGLGSCLHGGYGDRTLALLEVVDLLGKGGLRSAQRIGLVPSVRGAHQLATAGRVCRGQSYAKSRYREEIYRDVQEQPHVKEPPSASNRKRYDTASVQHRQQANCAGVPICLSL